MFKLLSFYIYKEEETDSAERRHPRCSLSTRPWRSKEPVVDNMQATKKLMLVDPQFPEQLKVDREYKQIQKPADSVVKTNLSLHIGKTLNDITLSNDQKVERYLHTLNRYYQVTDTVPIASTCKLILKNCSLCIVLTATDQKLQKSLKR